MSDPRDEARAAAIRRDAMEKEAADAMVSQIEGFLSEHPVSDRTRRLLSDTRADLIGLSAELARRTR